MARLTSQRIEGLLDAMADVCVLVVGDLMMDRYLFGSADRISPEAPVPVVQVDSERSTLGGAANVAANVAALGARCTLVGCAGNDEAGSTMRAELDRVGVDADGIFEIPDRPTTIKTRVMVGQHQIVRFDHEVTTDIGDDAVGRMVRLVADFSSVCDVLVMEDYDKGVLGPQVIDAGLEAARAHSIASVADPKRRNFLSYSGATWLKPNERELADALGEPVRPDDRLWMEATRRTLGCEHLLVTLGERGASLVGPGAYFLRVPAAARPVFDVSGAGDTVTAVVATALAAGATSSEAAVLANHVAAIGVARAGVVTVSPQEIREYLRDVDPDF